MSTTTIKESSPWYVLDGQEGVIIDGQYSQEFIPFNQLSKKQINDIIEGNINTYNTYSQSYGSPYEAGEEICQTDRTNIENEECTIYGVYETIRDDQEAALDAAAKVIEEEIEDFLNATTEDEYGDELPTPHTFQSFVWLCEEIDEFNDLPNPYGTIGNIEIIDRLSDFELFIVEDSEYLTSSVNEDSKIIQKYNIQQLVEFYKKGLKTDKEILSRLIN